MFYIMISDKKVGVTFSTFDFLHAGHILMLEEAKTVCDYLIVGLQTDPTIDRPDTKNKPIQTLLERQIQLMGCKYVDQIIVYETEKDLENILYIVKPYIRIIGEEYKDKEYTGRDICKELNIHIYYNKRKHNYSSTSIRERILSTKL